MSQLLDLPGEVRTYIWKLVFSDLNLTPQTQLNFNSGLCTPCQNNEIVPASYEEAYQPLLTCKQIYVEANNFLHNTLTLHISQHKALEKIQHIQTSVRSKVKCVILYIHLDLDERHWWMTALKKINMIFPGLRQLSLHYHMRPPTSYDHLEDGVYVAAPLVILPSHIQQNLHFDYIYEDVMFESPILGEIRCSDALDEHELVIRDLLVDPNFRSGAYSDDMDLMTAALLRIVRNHEQPWFEKLQRRRLEAIMQGTSRSTSS